MARSTFVAAVTAARVEERLLGRHTNVWECSCTRLTVGRHPSRSSCLPVSGSWQRAGGAQVVVLHRWIPCFCVCCANGCPVLGEWIGSLGRGGNFFINKWKCKVRLKDHICESV
jgi:hypothetical protein